MPLRLLLAQASVAWLTTVGPPSCVLAVKGSGLGHSQEAMQVDLRMAGKRQGERERERKFMFKRTHAVAFTSCCDLLAVYGCITMIYGHELVARTTNTTTTNICSDAHRR